MRLKAWGGLLICWCKELCFLVTRLHHIKSCYTSMRGKIKLTEVSLLQASSVRKPLLCYPACLSIREMKCLACQEVSGLKENNIARSYIFSFIYSLVLFALQMRGSVLGNEDICFRIWPTCCQMNIYSMINRS